MSIKDLTSVFSRYFLVGFYFPAFFGLAALSLTLTSDWLPVALRLQHVWNENARDFAHPLLVMAGLAIPIAFLLSGVAEAMTRLYRDLPLFFLYDHLPDRLTGGMTFYQRRRHGQLLGDAYTGATQQIRNRAAITLLERLPSSPDDILPNRFANAARAIEEYPSTRWRLDYDAIRHHLPRFFTDGETALLDDARTQLAFAVNFSFVLFAVGMAGTARVVWSVFYANWRSGELFRLIALASSYLAYRFFAVEALAAFGRRLRAAIDLHRLELFKTLGVAAFTSFTAAELLHGQTLSDFLLYGRQAGQNLDAFGREVDT